MDDNIKGKLSILSYLEKNKEFLNLLNKRSASISSVKGLAILSALLFKKINKKMFFLFPSLYEAEEFVVTLSDYLPNDSYYLFSCEELFRITNIISSKEMINERLSSIASTLSNNASILVAHTSSFLYQINSKETYLNNVFKIDKNVLSSDYSKKNIMKKLLDIGYVEVDHIISPGQVSFRGQIVDIYDPTKDAPIRLELFGDEIEEIRLFSLDNEMSYESISSTTIYPNSLSIITNKKEGILKLEKEYQDRAKNILDRITLDSFTSLLNEIKEDEFNYLSDSKKRLLPIFDNDVTTICSYLNDYIKYVYLKEDCLLQRNKIIEKQNDFFNKNIDSYLSFSSEKTFDDRLILDNFICIDDKESDFDLRPCSYKGANFISSLEMIRRYINEGYKIRISLNEPIYSKYINMLKQNNIVFSLYPTHSQLMLYPGSLSNGFELPKEKHVYLTINELYGINSHSSRFLSRYKESKLIKRFEELKIGDYVVYEVHGVGRYEGVVIMDDLEYLKVCYLNDAILYIPLSQYRYIRKYSSRDGYKPTLDKLGGSTWSRKKAKIKSKINYITDQLLDIYSQRTKEIGSMMVIDNELNEEFINSFPFPYTLSQRKCLQDIKDDMAKKIPMDRLITGDVGFGKTEMAFYAAYIAITNNKQVAFLSPTTILSMQHYKNAITRFAQFNIRICVFSRLVPLKEQKENIKLIKEGKMDLIIGTHRILSNLIEFKDLGLLIIDEEQRFGVTQKEKIKDKAKNIDCLTLSATPIPRTMQLSLLNVRQLSFLEEPPLNRLPVKTYVIKRDEELIKEAVERELNRKGQVYYLFNNISKIDLVKKKLEKLFPGYKVGICHGRLDENEIEQVMSEFYLGNINILVCTSIIESGLDIPTVNTIIVENSQNFGLSQLYQIKGRVGRSDILAYAYFFYDNEELINDTAKLRLKALKEFTELGAGYKIAMQDLNIRGAGDILGSEQSGFVDTLGYDAYIELINQVLKEKQLYNQGKNTKYNFELNFSLDAIIPSDYCSIKDRLTIYSELNDISSTEELNNYIIKVKDVYGNYPLEVNNLFTKKQIEINLNSGLFENFKENLGSYILTSSELLLSKKGVYLSWKDKLSNLDSILRISVQDNKFVFILNKTKNYLEELLFLTNTIIDDFKN